MSDRLDILNTIANVQTLQGQCSILMITAAEQKFDEKKIVRGPGGKFGEKKDEKKEPPPPPPRPQMSPEEREKQKQLNEQVEKIVTTAREFAFGKSAIAKMQGMANSLKGKFDKNQVFREAQKTSQQLQGNESLDRVIEQARDKIQDLKNTDSQSNGINQWQVTGVAIGLAVVVGGILGIVQKKKAFSVVEDLVNGKKIDLNIEDVAKKDLLLERNAVNEVVDHVYKKIQNIFQLNGKNVKNTKTDLQKNFDQLKINEPYNVELWKPSMSEPEAKEWAKDSVWYDYVYHGTSRIAAASISQEGFDLERSRRYVYGKAVYTASGNSGESIAKSYANQTKDALVLKIKVNIRKVVDWDEIEKKANDILHKKKKGTAISPREKMREMANQINMGDYFDAMVEKEALDDFSQSRFSQILADCFQLTGHDAIYMKKFNYLNVFDHKNVVVIND